MKLLIDSSNVNPATVADIKAAGAAAWMCKATQGTGFQDLTLPGARAGARQLGIPFGSYLYLQANENGAAQAAYYLAYAKPAAGDLEPAIDTEEAEGQPMAQVALVVNEAAQALEAKGLRPLLYGSTSWLQQLYVEIPELRRLRVWEADYPSPLTRLLPVRGQQLLRLLRRRLKLGHGVTVVAWQATSVWQIRGRGFDGSYLLANPATFQIPKAATP